MSVFAHVLWAEAPIRFCLKKNSKRRVFYHLGLQTLGGSNYSVSCAVAVFKVESSMEQSTFLLLLLLLFSKCFSDVFKVGVWSDPSFLNDPEFSNLTPDLMELQLFSSLLP